MDVEGEPTPHGPTEHRGRPRNPKERVWTPGRVGQRPSALTKDPGPSRSSKHDWDVLDD